MIELQGICTDSFQGLSLTVKQGQVCLLVVDSDAIKHEIVDVLSGFTPVNSGSVRLFGEDLYNVSNNKRPKLLSQVAFVTETGGLISNLKVWENILLPSQYHRSLCLDDTEALLMSLLSRHQEVFADFGLERFFHSQPGILPVHLKRLASMLRAIVSCPQVIISESIFEGLHAETVGCLLNLFNYPLPSEPAKLFITTDAKVHEVLKPDVTYRQTQRSFAQSK